MVGVGRVRWVRSQAWSQPRCVSSSRIRISLRRRPSRDGGVVCMRDGDFFWKAAPVGVVLAGVGGQGRQASMRPGNIPARSGAPCPLLGRAVGIENPGQGFGLEGFGYASDELDAEPLEIEIVPGPRLPRARRVDRPATVADHAPDRAGTPISVEGLPGPLLKLPPRTSNEQLRWTST